MARWTPNCEIIRNFAFGGKQYKKGKDAYLNGEVKDFAALHHCAVMLKTEAAPKVEDEPEGSTARIEGANV